MPVVDVDPDELRRLAGAEDVSDETLIDDLFALGLEFEGWTEDGALELEFAPDRLDRLSVEGIARSLRYQYGHDRGMHIPRTNRSNWTFVVDQRVPAQRPYVTGAIVRDVDLTEESLQSLITLQEKLHETMGRGRHKGAIGIHDLGMLKGRGATESAERTSITYTGIEPEAERFVPLEADAEMTPGEVLTDHPTGREYAEVVAEYELMPAIYDDLGLFSFPPVINSRRTEVTTDSRNLLVELTGTDQWTIDRMLAIVCYALDLRGAEIEDVEVAYPEYDIVRPDWEQTTKQVEHARIERTIGIELDRETVLELMACAGLDAQPIDENGLAYEVGIPPYRVDVLHPVDIVDDIGRAYGFNELEPRYPDVATVGSRHANSRFERAVRSLLTGVGFEDLLNFNLISHTANFERMHVAPDDKVHGAGTPVTIEEPYSAEYEIVRTWALPSVMLVLENNTHRAYPQALAEIGMAGVVDRDEPTKTAERRTVAGVIADHEASYEDGKARLAAVCRRLGVPLETPACEHPSFITGRSAAIDFGMGAVGVIGEIDPAVLVEHGLEVPVVAFEFPLAAIRSAAADQ